MLDFEACGGPTDAPSAVLDALTTPLRRRQSLARPPHPFMCNGCHWIGDKKSSLLDQALLRTVFPRFETSARTATKWPVPTQNGCLWVSVCGVERLLHAMCRRFTKPSKKATAPEPTNSINSTLEPAFSLVEKEQQKGNKRQPVFQAAAIMQPASSSRRSKHLTARLDRLRLGRIEQRAGQGERHTQPAARIWSLSGAVGATHDAGRVVGGCSGPSDVPRAS